jgi:lipid-A-disaccharide synthase-like uncharacterized protein
MSALLGTLGIAAIEGSYLPQIARLFRLKRSEDVSVLFPSLNLFGRVLAVSYSLAQGQSVFVFGFTLGIVLRGILLSQVVYYRWQHRQKVAVTSLGGHAVGDAP